MTRPLAVAALVVVAFLMSPVAALAHAVLLRAAPSGAQTLSQAPGSVQLLFSEALDPAFSSVQVEDGTGARVDLGDSHLDPNNDQLLVASLKPGLPSGVYLVSWRSLSAIDVHPDEGQYSLFVGVPVTATQVRPVTQNIGTPEAALGRWWFYLAASLFGGVLATWKLIISPLVTEDDLKARLRRRAYRLILAGGILLIAGTLFSAVAQAASAANVPLWGAFGSPLSELLLRGRFASIWWPRLGLEVASLALVAFGGIDGLASECALATLPAVLLTSALTSHGAALPTAAEGIGIDWLHIVGATAWVGGLVALAVLAPVLRGTKGVLARFSRFALIAAGLVLASGVLQGALEVGTWSALVATLYGQLLLVKIALLAAMLLLAGFNQLRGLGRGVPLEFALGVVVFGVAAMLSGTPPTPNS
jgi:copper transport protein